LIAGEEGEFKAETLSKITDFHLSVEGKQGRAETWLIRNPPLAEGLRMG
jgi:hypothetical protein